MSRRRKYLIAIVALLGVCMFLVILGSRGTTTPTQTAKVAAIEPTTAPGQPTLVPAAAKPTDAPKPTEPPKPTNTPAPSNTPKPSDTPKPPPATATPNVGKVGERREGGGVAVTVNEVTKAQQGGIFKPQPGNIFLVLDVTVETTTRDKAPYNPTYFKVKDAEGFEYDQTVATFEPSLKFGDLAKGEKARGKVPFQIKAGATGLVATYEPFVIAGGYVPIRIDLGQ